MRTIALIALLAAQQPDLDRDRLAVVGDGSPLAMITIVARHEDGTPVRGYISCGGYWYKHGDEADLVSERWMPFKTDARGAVIFNPHIDDEFIVCWAADKGKRGSVTASFSESNPLGVYELILREDD